MKPFVVTLSLLLLGGCDWEVHDVSNVQVLVPESRFTKVQTGTPISQVEQTLGKPAKSVRTGIHESWHYAVWRGETPGFVRMLLSGRAPRGRQIEGVVEFTAGKVAAVRLLPEAAPVRATSQPSNQPYRIGGSVTAPVVIRRVEPNFAKCKGTYSGNPAAEAILRKDGTVQDIKIVRGVHTCIDDQLVEALRRWQFQPGTLNGRPVDVIYVVTVNINYQ